jgi:replicative DNA helicase
VTRGLKLVVVDYLQLMTAELRSGRRETTREQEVASLARGLKAVAKELQVPVIALSQFSRALEAGKTPELHHLRESGELEQAANVVLLIHRKDGNTVAVEGDVDVIVAKNRGGPKGTRTLRWYPAETRFAEPETEPQQQRAFA